ncbi:MAG: hypothetical protein IPI62_01140 [Bacteroidetes bacterium]|nr:hypothetical protein [Bacteroidota bacterium]
MNLILIPKLSAVGAAISSITTNHSPISATLWRHKRLLTLKNIKLISMTLLFIGLCIGINYTAYHLDIKLMARFVIAAAVFHSFSTRLIGIRNIYRILEVWEENFVCRFAGLQVAFNLKLKVRHQECGLFENIEPIQTAEPAT